MLTAAGLSPIRYLGDLVMKVGKVLGAVRGAFLRVLPALVLVFGLALAFTFGGYQQQAAMEALNSEFALRSQDIFDRIATRLDDYGHILRGGAGLFASNETIDRDQWHRYASMLSLDQNLPGIQGFGFSEIIKPKDKLLHIERMKREGFPDYAIKPDGQRNLYSSIIYLEPFKGRNLRAFGYDMYSEPVRHEAMATACNEARITMSGKVTLVQEVDADVQAGFLMYVPVYGKNVTPDTIKERQDNIIGWVYAPFRMRDFIKGIVGNGVTMGGVYLDIIVFDGDTINQNSVMYHYDNDVDPVITGSRKPILFFTKTMAYGGHSWTIVVHSPLAFDSQYYDNRARLIELFGCLVSLFLAIIFWKRLSRGPGRQNHRQTEAEAQVHHPSRRKWTEHVGPYALATAISLAVAFVVLKADESERQAQNRAERVEVEARLDVIRLRLERALGTPMVRTRGMEAQIIAHGDVTPTEFTKVAEVLMRGHPSIRNMSVSHGTRVDLVYPVAGNEKVIGTDLRYVEQRWPIISRAIDTHSQVVQGPVALITGGIGLIIRNPVFLPDAHGGESHLFGLVNIVLDISSIYSEVGLDREDLPIKVAIRGMDGLGVNGGIISGDASIFTMQPIEMDAEFPSGSWRLAAIPRNGWEYVRNRLSISRVLGGSFFFFVLLISFGTASHLMDRSQLLQRVGSSEERFRRLLQIASDGVHILDEDGNLVMWSDSFLQMLGYSEEEARTLNVTDWDVAIPKDRFLAFIHELITTPTVFGTRHRRKDGFVIDVEINTRGIELDGKPYLYASSRDISERMAHDVELRQAKLIAEDAARAKADFLAMMSHEIRTPITSVLGMADLLCQTEITVEQVGYLNILKSSTKTLLTILNDILDISKIEAGKVSIEATDFNLCELTREVVGLGQSTALAKGLSLNLVIADDVPSSVIGDPTRMKQVLFNLMSNAIKFTQDGSVIISLKLQQRAEQLLTILFEVEDTGIGMTREQIDHLFTAFSQADQTTTRRFGGTGLGLAISKKLVELMGGEIGVESEPGVGARFWFALPFELGRAAGSLSVPHQGMQPPPQAPNRPLRILLAEDNRINQMLVRSMLQKFGHTVRVVDNGRQALEAVMADEFDAVLMDMQMPEMDGEEATRAIRTLPPPKGDMPVLALTADVMADHRDRYLASGVNDLVPKPIDWKVLLDALSRQTDQNRPMSAPLDNSQ